MWLRPERRAAGLVVLAGVLGSVLATAAAQAQAQEGAGRGRRVLLGPDGGTGATVALARESGGGTGLRVGRRRFPLSPTNLEGLEVRPVTLAGGRRVAVVVAGGQDGVAAVLGGDGRRPELLFSGPLGWTGEDLGERTRVRVETRDRTGDGVPDLVVGRQREGVGPCTGEPALLDPRAVDPETGALRPVVLRRETATPRTARVVRRPAAPDTAGVGILRFAETSRASDADPAAALTDGDPATYWSSHRGGDGREEFLVGRFDGGAVAALDLVPRPVDAPRAPPPPRVLIVVDGASRALRVAIPTDVAPGEVLRILPPGDAPALDGTCLALIFRETQGDDRRAGVALAEVRALAPATLDGGLPALVSALGGAEGDRAARLLAAAGTAGAEAVLAAWDRLSPRAAQRAGRVAGASQTEGLLARAAADPRSGVRDAMLQAAEERRNGAALAALATGAHPQGERAATALVGAWPPAESVPVLLRALSAEGGADRPALRDALRRAGELAPEALRGALGGAEAPASPAARAALALALAPVEALSPEVSALLAEAPRATAFPDRWRLVAAADAATPDVDVGLPWLDGLVTGADEWMLRDAALAARAERGPVPDELALAATRDDNPRVRGRAVGLLARRHPDHPRLRELAEGDPWPMVRADALDALATGDPSAPNPALDALLRAAVGDPNKRVRAAAIRGLTTRRVREAWPLVRRRLRDRNEWPDVLEAGIRYVAETCRGDGLAELRGLVGRTARPDPWDPDVGVAVTAVAAMGALPGAEVDQTLEEAQAPIFPPAVRRAAARAEATRDPCTPPGR